MSKQQEALRLALDALGQLWLFCDEAAVIANPAIKALREALAEQPAPMIRGDIRDGLVDDEPAQQEPVAWAPYLSDRADGVKGHYAIARWNPRGYREVWNLRRHEWAAYSDDVLSLEEADSLLRLITIPTHKVTSPQPAQLPFGVGGGLVAIKTLLSRDPCVHANTAIQMIDAILAEQPAQQEPNWGVWPWPEKPAPEQPAQQEPVVMWDGKYQIEFGNLSAYKHGEHSWIPLYTSPQPAQRTWVALTDEERIMCRSYDPEEAVTKTEAKLKEKNT